MHVGNISSLISHGFSIGNLLMQCLSNKHITIRLQ